MRLSRLRKRQLSGVEASGRKGQPPGLLLGGNELPNSRMFLARLGPLQHAGVLLDESFYCLAQGVLFADLAHGAPHPVGVEGGGGYIVGFQPAQQIGARSEAFAMRKQTSQAIAGLLYQLGEKCFRRAVKIAEESQVDGVISGRQAVGGNVIRGLVVNDEDSGIVQAVEAREGYQRILRIDDAGSAVHGGEQLTELVQPAGSDRSQHHEVGLRRHQCGNCRAKWMVRFLSQYTTPRYRPGPSWRISSRMCLATSEVSE